MTRIFLIPRRQLKWSLYICDFDIHIQVICVMLFEFNLCNGNVIFYTKSRKRFKFKTCWRGKWIFDSKDSKKLKFISVPCLECANGQLTINIPLCSGTTRSGFLESFYDYNDNDELDDNSLSKINIKEEFPK